jgi:hypothetical protein
MARLRMPKPTKGCKANGRKGGGEGRRRSEIINAIQVGSN